MSRIAVGGFQHETNVFAPYKADFAAFERRDEWPPLCVGARMVDNVAGVHLPVSGAMARLRELGHSIVPLLWCAATPSAHVEEDAFERIMAMLLDELRRAMPVDGVLLDLHGAMVCEHLPDGDGEILRRVRAALGDAAPIVASLDLHANISDQMIAQASALDVYRTYPHIDMGDTGARAAEHLHQLLHHGLARFPAVAARRPDFMIPLNWGCTLSEPMQSIYEFLPTQINGNVASLSLACGFPHSDVFDAGPAVVGYGFAQDAVDAAAENQLREIQKRKREFRGEIYGVADGVDEAIRLSQTASAPVVIADTQDNPGGGGPGDTTEILRALVERGARGAVVGIIADAEASERAHAAGRGAMIRLKLGGKSGVVGSAPFDAEFRVINLADGRFTATGPMLAGADMDLGPTALLQTGGVQVVVGPKAIQTMDQTMFRHLGVEPSLMRIIALKSSVHFRNDFQDISAAILIVTAPGPVIADLAELPFQTPRLRQLVAR